MFENNEVFGGEIKEETIAYNETEGQLNNQS